MPRPSHQRSASDVETVGTKTAEAIDAEWAKFHEEHFAVDVVPPGWMTAQRYAKINGGTSQLASSQLRCAVRQGLVEMKKFLVIGEAGERRNMSHFRILKKPKT